MDFSPSTPWGCLRNYTWKVKFNVILTLCLLLSLLLGVKDLISIWGMKNTLQSIRKFMRMIGWIWPLQLCCSFLCCLELGNAPTKLPAMQAQRKTSKRPTKQQTTRKKVRKRKYQEQRKVCCSKRYIPVIFTKHVFLFSVIMVVGAGRGPLVRASLTAGEESGRKVRVYAVEKNPNAVVTWVSSYFQTMQVYNSYSHVVVIWKWMLDFHHNVDISVTENQFISNQFTSKVDSFASKDLL